MPFPNRESAPEGASRVKGGQVTAQAVVPRWGCIVSKSNRESTPGGVARIKAGDEGSDGAEPEHESTPGRATRIQAGSVGICREQTAEGAVEKLKSESTERPMRQ